MSKQNDSRPFAVGDRVMYNEEVVGVVTCVIAGSKFPVYVSLPTGNMHCTRSFTELGVEVLGGPVTLRHATPPPSVVEEPTEEPVEAPPVQTSAFDTQVGGGHYSSRPDGYQPFQISKVLGLNPVEHTVLKYLLRHRDKNGAVDLQKAKHCLDILIEQEYPNAI